MEPADAAAMARREGATGALLGLRRLAHRTSSPWPRSPSTGASTAGTLAFVPRPHQEPSDLSAAKSTYKTVAWERTA